MRLVPTHGIRSHVKQLNTQDGCCTCTLSLLYEMVVVAPLCCSVSAALSGDVLWPCVSPCSQSLGTWLCFPWLFFLRCVDFCFQWWCRGDFFQIRFSLANPSGTMRWIWGLPSQFTRYMWQGKFSSVTDAADGQSIIFKKFRYLSNTVSNPLFSSRRLFQHDWSIGSHDRLPRKQRLCKGLTIPLNFKHASLVLETPVNFTQ